MGLTLSNGWAYGVSVDTETSGLGRAARVVQIAALRFRCRWDDARSELDIEFSSAYRLLTLVRPPPGTWFDPGAVRVTGIDAARVREAPSFAAISDRLQEVVADLPIVAHNAPFDRRMIAGEFDHLGGTPPEVEWICSMQAAKSRGHTKAALSVVASALRIKPEGGLHDAGVDAELAARVYGTLVKPGSSITTELGFRPPAERRGRPFPSSPPSGGWGMGR